MISSGNKLKLQQTRRKRAGILMADSLVEWLNMMYNKSTAQGVLYSLIERLQKVNFRERINDDTE